MVADAEEWIADPEESVAVAADAILSRMHRSLFGRSRSTRVTRWIALVSG
jgi:hypothetical protein